MRRKRARTGVRLPAVAVLLAVSLAALWIEARDVERVVCVLVVVGLLLGSLVGYLAGGARLQLRRWALGIGLAVVAGTALGEVGSMRQSRRTRAEGDRIGAALAAYWQQSGGYPEQLADLVPRQLANVPPTRLGLWRQTPFRYQREGDGYRMWFPGGLLTTWERGPIGIWYQQD
jgi:hypothetical protein